MTCNNQTLNVTDNHTIVHEPSSQNRAGELYYWTIVSFCLCIIGSFNNILVLLVTWPRAGGSKVGLHMLILHFIAINLFMCLINHPIRTIMVVANQHGHRAPDGVCPFADFFFGIGWFALSWADAGLAINRVLALYVPHQHREWASTRSAMISKYQVSRDF